MNQELDAQGRRAGAAVHDRTQALPPDQGLDGVLRRGRRPRPSRVLAVVLLALLAIPLGVVLVGGQQRTVEFADEPTATPEPEVAPPAPTATPAPVEETAPPTPEPPPPPVETDPTEAPDPAPTEAPDPAPTGPSALGTFGTDPVASPDFPFDGGDVAHLTDVRTGVHDGFDRVVLELSGGDVPGHRISYQQPPILQDGSGDPIEVAGTAFLELILTPAAGVDFDAGPADGYELTYTGPDRVGGGGGVVTEVVRTGDFEATLTWVVGLRDRSPFAVTWLDSPLRLVIDIAHAG